MEYAHFDTSQFPVVVVAFTGEAANDENFEAYLNGLHDLYESGDSLGIIFDGRNAKLPGLKYQKQQADWLKENEAMMKSQCVGTAYVITSTIIRGVLKAIFAITPQPVPYKVCPSMEEARKYIESQLAASA
jgi:hypothetical protein